MAKSMDFGIVTANLANDQIGNLFRVLRDKLLLLNFIDNTAGSRPETEHVIAMVATFHSSSPSHYLYLSSQHAGL